MKVSPEDKDIGKENFYAAVGSKHLRKTLLSETVKGELATKNGLGAKYFRYGTIDVPVKLGIIGTGDEGGVLIGALNPAYADVVAIADIRPFNIYRAFHGDKSGANARRARPGLLSIYKKKWRDEAAARKDVKVYEDGYEALLDDPDVEAVIIALPLHLHAEASIKAMRKGKHVLCEKLMGHSVAQCKEMARVAETEDKLLAIGHQRHYSVLYQNAVEIVKKNLIGPIHHIRAQWHRDNLPGSDTWQKPLPTEPQMQEDLEKALAALKEAEAEYDKRKKTEMDKLFNSDISDSERAQIKKWEGDRIGQPKKIAIDEASLRDELAKSKPDPKVVAKLQGTLAKRHQRFRDVHAALTKKLGLAKYDPIAANERVEILTNQLKDALIHTKVKDFGYQDHPLSDRTVTALEELIRWRLWDRTGGGLMAELGSHQLDASGIFISAAHEGNKKQKPLSVTAVGGRHIFRHDRDIDDHVYCSFEYPAPGYQDDPEKKIVVSYSSINGNGFGGYGETILGTEGTLILDREKEVILLTKPKNGAYGYTKVREQTNKKGKKVYSLIEGKAASHAAALGRLALKDPISRGYTEEIEHLCWAIREKEKLAAAADGGKPAEISVPLVCNPEVALADAVIALTTNLAIQRGKNGENCRIEFEDEWFQIHSDATPEGTVPDVNRPQYR